MDIANLRADTPGCQTKVHFNNSGAALPPYPVLQAMQDYLAEEANCGGYETAAANATALNRFYLAAGRLLNASAKNIAFTSSATNSFARALSCIPFKKRDVVVIANEDYASNQLQFLSLEERFGIELVRAHSMPEGGVDVDHMASLIRDRNPRLVSLTHVPSNTGLIQPVAEIGKVCRELDIPYLVDACQSAGQLPLDVEEMGCDFLCATLRKYLRGPRGAGFLYVSDRILHKPWYPLFLDMYAATWTDDDTFIPASDAKRFQDWEQSYALIAGGYAAVHYANEIGLQNIADRNKYLCGLLRPRLESLPGVTLLDKGKELASIITLSAPVSDPQWLLTSLRERNINTAISVTSSALIDFKSKGVNWALRISPHYYNTEDEIDILLDALESLFANP
ncbi:MULTISPECIES: aminotransferase class V-fold PLP-dependent enzyme [unclassified Chitinophaga]|uniref:aminotransferase class V-fold PLP-dependent enzyme n=1 Tax=unclassified Chitinophaga TaxID=2619133 RepID=UPI0009C7E0E6|nr:MULTISPECIES: aminotransferase class V-fold PLP-dependent enzyme [unclassified Chitinophaga]OMP78947.1 aminotransferase [[Flexibacter] sp. ATCC 35208]WPV64366.1 aminotransferase class V-fold PLP-dependent enzyme [Chitinophaga sp. LS1]